MDKIRFTGPKGKAIYLNEKLANNPTFIKKHKLTRDEIKEPEVVMNNKPETKEEKEVVENVITDLTLAKEKYKELYEKKPHHTWGLDVLNQKINLKLHEQDAR